MNGTVTISWQALLTLASVVGVVIAFFKYYNKGYDMVKHQKEQDEAIKSIREEQALMTFGILACLKGLHEQGANGPVTDAIEKFEKHLNIKAHETKT